MTMVKISDCFYNVINLLCFAMKLAAMICKLDRFLENWQIVQCNLQIGWPIYQLADWQIGWNIYMTAGLRFLVCLQEAGWNEARRIQQVSRLFSYSLLCFTCRFVSPCITLSSLIIHMCSHYTFNQCANYYNKRLVL